MGWKITVTVPGVAGVIRKEAAIRFLPDAAVMVLSME